MTHWLKLTPVLLATFLSACGTSSNSDPFEEYLRLTPADSFSRPHEAERLQGFLAMFSNLSPASVEQHLDSTYAEDVYFNDTFHTFRTREEMRAYFTSLTGGAQTTVIPIDYAEAGNQIWLRWKMRTQFRVFWKDIDVTSVGMTHLMFDENNLIVMHQDYWDGVEGFYSRLPLVGGIIRGIRSGLGN